MGRKDDINSGAGAACLVVAVLAGFATQSFWGGVLAFVVLAGILTVLGVIR